MMLYVKGKQTKPVADINGIPLATDADCRDLTANLRRRVVNNLVEIDLSSVVHGCHNLTRTVDPFYCKNKQVELENRGYVELDWTIWLHCDLPNAETWEEVQYAITHNGLKLSIISGSQRVAMARNLGKHSLPARVFLNCSRMELIELMGQVVMTEQQEPLARRVTWLWRIMRPLINEIVAHKVAGLDIVPTPDGYPKRDAGYDEEYPALMKDGIIYTFQAYNDRKSFHFHLARILPKYFSRELVAKSYQGKDRKKSTLVNGINAMAKFLCFPPAMEREFYQLCDMIDSGEVDITTLPYKTKQADSLSKVFEMNFGIPTMEKWLEVDWHLLERGVTKWHMFFIRLAVSMDRSKDGGVAAASHLTPKHHIVNYLLVHLGIPVGVIPLGGETTLEDKQARARIEACYASAEHREACRLFLELYPQFANEHYTRSKDPTARVEIPPNYATDLDIPKKRKRGGGGGGARGKKNGAKGSGKKSGVGKKKTKKATAASGSDGGEDADDVEDDGNDQVAADSEGGSDEDESMNVDEHEDEDGIQYLGRFEKFEPLAETTRSKKKQQARKSTPLCALRDAAVQLTDAYVDALWKGFDRCVQGQFYVAESSLDHELTLLRIMTKLPTTTERPFGVRAVKYGAFQVDKAEYKETEKFAEFDFKILHPLPSHLHQSAGKRRIVLQIKPDKCVRQGLEEFVKKAFTAAACEKFME
ncbi:uncharacterized protein LOC129586659 [Paramacrobiotus metropolitanus]|uniref:uncharacterized protein LOC129586659 n=1 Tax=Paramacrobiotus metropolitanus TaxID=2943436 RepID=UPI00244648E2|nr:uncharacterized protein LOC129586659 [Paramacrobiotus metropolitanus]